MFYTFNHKYTRDKVCTDHLATDSKYYPSPTCVGHIARITVNHFKLYAVYYRMYIYIYIYIYIYKTWLLASISIKSAGVSTCLNGTQCTQFTYVLGCIVNVSKEINICCRACQYRCKFSICLNLFLQKFYMGLLWNIGEEMLGHFSHTFYYLPSELYP